MTDAHHLNDLDTKINDKGFFEKILNERERFYMERIARLTDRMDEQEKALVLQAKEYARRLHDLNGEYQRDRARQNDYVTTDKWEATNEGERVARVAALLRVDEKFDEYVKRYEQRQREVDLLLAAQKGAAEQAIRAAEDQGRKSNRNIGIAGLVLTLIVIAANFLPDLFRGDPASEPEPAAIVFLANVAPYLVQ